MRTFGSVLAKHGGAGPGFDLLRLGLAVAILSSHCAAISGGRGFFPSLFHAVFRSARADPIVAHTVNAASHFGLPFVVSHVPMFFAVSGFLVAGSAFRTKRVVPFLALRFFRIFPALVVEVALSAVFIGAVFTTLPLHEYFTSAQFYRYFGNIAGWVTMFLPGVSFAHDNVVNANLWTLPGEFHCYLLLAVLIVSGIVFNRAISTMLFAAATVVLIVANSVYDYNSTPFILANSINVFYFCAGAMFFIWRDRIPYSWWLVVPCALLSYALLFTAHAVYVIPFVLTYVTIFVGLTDFGQYRIVQSGDYSYGIYLYGFPICQVAYTVIPALHGNMLGLFALGLTFTAAFAFLSWHLVEKRFLRLRKYFSTRSAQIAAELHPEAFTPGVGSFVPVKRS